MIEYTNPTRGEARRKETEPTVSMALGAVSLLDFLCRQHHGNLEAETVHRDRVGGDAGDSLHHL